MRTFAFLCLAFFAACQNQNSGTMNAIPESQVISYPSNGQQYVILIVEDNGVNEGAAKKRALKEAAQITINQGYRYFSILSEETIEVTKTSQESQPQIPGNLYQELIIEKNFSRDSLNQSGSLTNLSYPAVRLVIELYMEKPALKKSYDAQKFLNLGVFTMLFKYTTHR